VLHGRLLKRLLRWPMGICAVLSSDLFERDYYLRQVVGRSDESKARKAPLFHYLRVGGNEGLNPSPAFDSDWYLSVYTDVRDAGLNPLVHYLQHGLLEGRLPYLGAKPITLSRSPRMPLTARLNN